MKKISKILLFIFIVLSISVAAYFAYDYFLGTNDNSEPKVKVLKKINNYDYTLKENATKIYKDEFNELSDILDKDEVSYEDYAKSIAKLFVIDFYTLDNKLSKNDVGGTEFVYPDIADNFIEHARSTVYRYIKVNDGDKNDELPEVSEISNIELIETTFTFKEDKSTIPAYKVNIMWEYKEDMGYEKEANIIIVKKDNKLYIVEMD